LKTKSRIEDTGGNIGENDAHNAVEGETLATIFESLILAQDERWRRA